MTKPKALPIDLLSLEAETQNRIAIDDGTILDYVEQITASGNKWPFPPIDVYHDGNRYMVSDGFHRTIAAEKAKRSSIPCIVHKGTARDARIAGMKANDTHGLRMSREDKRACVEWLLDDSEKRTQTEIAEVAGVSRRTVSAIVADRKSENVQIAHSVHQHTEGEEVFETVESGEDDSTEAQVTDATEETTPRPPRNGKDKPGDGKPPKQFPRSHWWQQWDRMLGPMLRLTDKISHEVGGNKSEAHNTVIEHLKLAADEMAEWMGVEE